MFETVDRAYLWVCYWLGIIIMSEVKRLSSICFSREFAKHFPGLQIKDNSLGV